VRGKGEKKIRGDPRIDSGEEKEGGEKGDVYLSRRGEGDILLSTSREEGGEKGFSGVQKGKGGEESDDHIEEG